MEHIPDRITANQLDRVGQHHVLRRSNDQAKLPGPPATTWKLGKPKWRPRSTSAVGSPMHLMPSASRSNLQVHNAAFHNPVLTLTTYCFVEPTSALEARYHRRTSPVHQRATS